MKIADVIVLGSINLDIMVNVAQYPKYGDTVIAQRIQMLPGGKGANQAVAVAKQASELVFVGAVGADDAGRQMLSNLAENGIDTSYVLVDENNGTGTFVPIVDEGGENTMMGTLGANATLPASHVEQVMGQVDAKVLEGMGVGSSIIKMGSKGNIVYQAGKVDFVPSLKVTAVNTVGAGDTFAGALASEYARTGDLVQAVRYGNVCAGLKVSRGSGQGSIPTRDEVERYLTAME